MATTVSMQLRAAITYDITCMSFIPHIGDLLLAKPCLWRDGSAEQGGVVSVRYRRLARNMPVFKYFLPHWGWGIRMLKQFSFNENDDMSILFCLSSKFQPLRNGGRRVNLIWAKSERKRLLEVFLT